MNLLLETNTTFKINDMPDKISEDIRFCILDYTNTANVDYYFIPMFFMEYFYSMVLDLQIGPYRIQMPKDWNIIIGEKDLGDVEIVPLKDCISKDFSAFCINPISSFRTNFLKLEILDAYPDNKWYFPKLKHGHILCVPLEVKPNPMCAYFVKETNKLPDVLEISKLH